MTRELEQARRDVERAAREVGRLSAEVAGPLTAEINDRFFRYSQNLAGRRFLGVVIESTELGAQVTAVTPNGPAASAGVLAGDTIVAIDGVDVTQQSGEPNAAEAMMTQMQSVAPGETVNLRVMRGGDYRDIAVALPKDEPSWFSFNMPSFRAPEFQRFGDWDSWSSVFTRSQPWSEFEFAALTPELGEYFGTSKGLLVVHSPADDAFGFRDGDVILDIGGREPQSPEHALRILSSFAPGESLRVSIMRKQARQTLEIKIPESTDNV
jgi:S1-C subfamily serine protease